MSLTLFLLVPAAHASSDLSIIPDPVLVAVQMLPFFAAMAILHSLAFKPFIAYLEDREAATAGARAEALELQQKAEERLARYEAKLAEARAEVAKVRAAHRAKAMEAREAALAQARAEAEARLNEAIEAINGERALAAQQLERLSGELASDITQKVLGRATAA
ncbi:MAG: hypothetical protein H6739_36270 [Alphaproteobacteria bacterium]|nr:hypothetical protein [Alphaproteobacteria bacterium]